MFQVTPLWCAAVANKLEVVKTLIRHRANVNATSDTESTPVRSACYMTNIEVVKCLVENGANIHKPNVNGGTCLINSVQSVDLCSFLIHKTANVNAQDNSGNLALHYAIREGRMETVKLLMKHNSNTFLKNDFGDDALQTASLRGYADILEYLISKIKPSVERQIEVYELMAANFVDEKHDIQRALQTWRSAMDLRHHDPDNVRKTTISEPIKAYNWAKEAESHEELQEIALNPDTVYMLALLIRERILGPDHKDTIFGLMYRGAVYADTHHYQRCVDLWKYAFQLRHEKQEPLNHECLFTLQALCKLFWEINDEHTGGFTNEAVQFADVIQVLEMSSAELEPAREAMHQQATGPSHPKEEFHTMLLLVLHLIHLLCKMPKDEEQMYRFKKAVHRLVRLNPQTQHGGKLLHLAVQQKTSHVTDEFYSEFPSLDVVKVLLECGTDVNCLDNDHNMPLHLCAESSETGEEQATPPGRETEAIVKYLIQHNAHPDARNKAGQMAAESIKSAVRYNLADHVTLKCLAARAVREHDISFVGEVPQSLEPFIEMH